MKLFGIVGAGGFGREVIPVAKNMLDHYLANQDYQLVFIDEETPNSPTINNYPILSMSDFIAHHAKEKYFNIAIASHAARKRIAEFLIQNNVQPFTIKAANSLHLDHNQIAEGAIFCPFTTVTANAKIGKFFHANIYSYVGHDCIIGDYVTFAPNVQCNGTIIIEDEVYIGTGAIIKQGMPNKPMVIGRGAIIGMGAVVTKSVAPHTTVIGNPAQPLQSKTPA